MESIAYISARLGQGVPNRMFVARQQDIETFELITSEKKGADPRRSGLASICYFTTSEGVFIVFSLDITIQPNEYMFIILTDNSLPCSIVHGIG